MRKLKGKGTSHEPQRIAKTLSIVYRLHHLSSLQFSKLVKQVSKNRPLFLALYESWKWSLKKTSCIIQKLKERGREGEGGKEKEGKGGRHGRLLDDGYGKSPSCSHI